MENLSLIYQSGILSLYEVTGPMWPGECDLDKEEVKYVIKLKNTAYGYDKRINLCENHYNELKNIYNNEK